MQKNYIPKLYKILKSIDIINKKYSLNLAIMCFVQKALFIISKIKDEKWYNLIENDLIFYE